MKLITQDDRNHYHPSTQYLLNRFRKGLGYRIYILQELIKICERSLNITKYVTSPPTTSKCRYH